MDKDALRGASSIAIPLSAVHQRRSNTAGARRALRGAAGLWFCAAVAGQWLFVYYIASFYGRATAAGDFAAWNRNRGLTDGYVAGDTAGNLFFIAHVLLAAILTFGGALQLVPWLRRRSPAFHRWNGRLFMITALGAASSGLWLEWVRGTGLRAPTGVAPAVAVTLDAVLILAFAGLAWRAALRRNVAVHAHWATCLFLTVNGTWFMRVGVRVWGILTGGADATDFFRFWSFGAYLLPLAVYPIYLRAAKASAPLQYAMAAGLLVLTLMMGIGTVATFMRTWAPLLAM